MSSDAQSRAGAGTFDQSLDQQYALNDDAFTGPRDMREDSVFNRIVFRAAGGGVRYP
jgi:hypothetical protein